MMDLQTVNNARDSALLVLKLILVAQVAQEQIDYFLINAYVQQLRLMMVYPIIAKVYIYIYKIINYFIYLFNLINK